MAQKRRRGVNRRKKGSNGRPLVLLLMTVVVLVLAFVALEKLKKTMVEKPTVVPAAEKENRQKMPPRPSTTEGGMKGYSSPHGGTGAPVPPPDTVPAVVAPQREKGGKPGSGRVAIIVDDMGNSLEEARSLLAINLPITFSVIPGLPKARAVAEAAHGKGREVMVHIPMEPTEYERKPFEKNGLLLSQPDQEITRRLNDYLRAVPYAAGANNHMGSRFTEDRAKMRTVLGVLKGKGMFFIDSKTTPRSVGERMAREMGMKTASRGVFLDNSQNVAAIRAQLDQMVEAARKHGSAIAICHPHRTTIQALAEAMPALRKSGITFVYASEMVR